jgi:hypothetical protein
VLSNASVDSAARAPRTADTPLATETQFCLLLLVLLASLAFGFRRADAEPAEADEVDVEESSPGSRLLTVQARLVAPGLSVPHCGVLKFTQLMRYEVLDVVEGSCSEKEILVAQACPETALRDGRGRLAPFRAGDLHRLRLRRADNAPADPAGHGGPPRYEATQAMLLRP